MKDQELFELRGKHIEFTDVLRFKEKIDSLIGNDFSIPMVTGQYGIFETNRKEWKIKNLMPLLKSDELTVRNFMCGLENFVKEKFISNDFLGKIYVGGVDSTNKIHYGEQVLFFYFSKRDKINCGLDFKFVYNYNQEKSKAYNGFVYSVESFLEKSHAERLMGNFLGPKRKGN